MWDNSQKLFDYLNKFKYIQKVNNIIYLINNSF